MEKYLPTYREKSVFEMNFKKYYELGYRIILSDLDNTITTYSEDVPSENLIKLIKKINDIGFVFVIISNSNENRVEKFATKLGVNYIASANKPGIYKTKEKIEMLKTDKILFIGDQILTDVLYANRLLINSVLVDSISISNQKWYTKINRLRERRILKYFKKHDFDKYLKLSGEIIE